MLGCWGLSGGWATHCGVSEWGSWGFWLVETCAECSGEAITCSWVVGSRFRWCRFCLKLPVGVDTTYERWTGWENTCPVSWRSGMNTVLFSDIGCNGWGLWQESKFFPGVASGVRPLEQVWKSQEELGVVAEEWWVHLFVTVDCREAVLGCTHFQVELYGKQEVLHMGRSKREVKFSPFWRNALPIHLTAKTTDCW